MVFVPEPQFQIAAGSSGDTLLALSTDHDEPVLIQVVMHKRDTERIAAYTVLAT